jgi:hypothetical protein
MKEIPLELELTETEELKKAVATELTFQVDTLSIEELLKEQHGTSNAVDNRENS